MVYATDQRFVINSAIVGTPTDSNTSGWGRDCVGFAMAGGNFVHSTLTLTETGAFASASANDLIYLMAGTGVNVGLYQIATVTDNDNVVLTESITGAADVSDASITSSPGPWATLQYAFDTLAAGEVLNIAADATYKPTALINCDATGSSNKLPFTYQGANSRGIWDGSTQPTISAEDAGAAVDMIAMGESGIHHAVWKDVRFSGGPTPESNGGRDLVTGPNLPHATYFERCRFDHAERYGVYGAETTELWSFVRCEFDNNDQHGFTRSGDGKGVCQMWYCSLHDNGRAAGSNNGSGVLCSMTASSYGSSQFHHCVVYDNDGEGLNFADSNAAYDLQVTNCVIYGNNSDGVRMDHGTTDENGVVIAFNNVIAANGAYGWNAINGDERAYICRANAFYNNTSGETNLTTDFGANIFPDPMGDNISADPEFVSVTDGSEDFTPATGSPLIGTGVGALTA